MRLCPSLFNIHVCVYQIFIRLSGMDMVITFIFLHLEHLLLFRIPYLGLRLVIIDAHLVRLSRFETDLTLFSEVVK